MKEEEWKNLMMMTQTRQNRTQLWLCVNHHRSLIQSNESKYQGWELNIRTAECCPGGCHRH